MPGISPAATICANTASGSSSRWTISAAWSARQLRERHPLVRRHFPARRRDRIAVRVVARVAERRGQRLGLLLAGAVLAPLGVGVPLAGVEAGLVGEVALPQPVDADDPQRLAAAVGGEAQRAVVVVEQVEPAEAVDELGGGAPGEAEGAGQAFERRRALAVLPVPDVLERVLDLDAIGGQPARGASATPARCRARRRATASDQRDRTSDEGDDRGRAFARSHPAMPGGRSAPEILINQNYEASVTEKSRRVAAALLGFRHRHGPIQHRRELPEGGPSGVSRLPAGHPAAADGPAGRGAGRRARHRHDDGQGAGRVGAGRVRALQRRVPDRGGVEAGGDGAAPPPPGRALPGAGDGHALGRGARRRRAPRARRLGSADRADGRDARPSRSPTRTAIRSPAPKARSASATSRRCSAARSASAWSSRGSPIRTRRSCASSSATG